MAEWRLLGRPNRLLTWRAKNMKRLTFFEALEATEKDAGWGDAGLSLSDPMIRDALALVGE